MILSLCPGLLHSSIRWDVVNCQFFENCRWFFVIGCVLQWMLKLVHLWMMMLQGLLHHLTMLLFQFFCCFMLLVICYICFVVSESLGSFFGDGRFCCRNVMWRRKISASFWTGSMWVTREPLLRNKAVFMLFLVEQFLHNVIWSAGNHGGFVSTDQYVWNGASHVQAIASKMLSLKVTFMCSAWLWLFIFCSL